MNFSSSDTECDDSTEYNIRVVNNKIYFYEEINEKTILELTFHINEVSRKIMKMAYDFDLKTVPKIMLHIQSHGGEVFSGLSAMNTIENNKVPVVTIVDGFVASAATFLLLGGHERCMQKNAFVLIHQVRGEFWGKHEDLKDEYKNSKGLMKIIKKMYKSKSNMEIDDINSIISKERYMNAEDCLAFKLVDSIC